MAMASSSGSFDAVVGQRVSGRALSNSCPQLFGIARQRPVRLRGHAPFDQSNGASSQTTDAVDWGPDRNFHRRMNAPPPSEITCGRPDCTARTRLASAAASMRAKHRLALRIENFADGGACAAFDLFVQIEETPAQLVGQGASDGGFAASHESDQIDAGSAFELKNHIVLTARARESDNSSMQQGLLPLFPLQVVLLPGAELPLHIFEDRYKEMIGEVMRDRHGVRRGAGERKRNRQYRLHGDDRQGAARVSGRPHGHSDARAAALRDLAARTTSGRSCAARWSFSTMKKIVRSRPISGSGRSTDTTRSRRTPVDLDAVRS